MQWLGGAVHLSLTFALKPLSRAFLSSWEHYLKVYAPLTMVFMGCCAWFFFRQLRFAPIVCVIGGLGAGLNMHFFSNACWGLGTWEVSAAMVFVALGILVSPDIRQLWIKAVLAGFSVGMVVMEGFDVGAIFSIYVGIFLLFYFLTSESRPVRGALKAVGIGALVVICAVLISASTLYTLVGTQLTGTGGAGQSEVDKEALYDFASQWQIPKIESLRVLIPGLFGYRMMDHTTSTNKASSYWGSIAEDPRVERLDSGNPKIPRAARRAIPWDCSLKFKIFWQEKISRRGGRSLTKSKRTFNGATPGPANTRGCWCACSRFLDWPAPFARLIRLSLPTSAGPPGFGAPPV